MFLISDFYHWSVTDTSPMNEFCPRQLVEQVKTGDFTSVVWTRNRSVPLL